VIEKEILVAVQPLAVEAAIVAEQDAVEQIDEQRRALELELQQATTRQNLLHAAITLSIQTIALLLPSLKLDGTQRSRSFERSRPRLQLEARQLQLPLIATHWSAWPRISALPGTHRLLIAERSNVSYVHSSRRSLSM
jgi:hypothetical protein